MKATTLFDNASESLFYIQLFIATLLILLSLAILIYGIVKKEKMIFIPLLLLLISIGTAVNSINFDREIIFINMLSTYKGFIIFLVIVMLIAISMTYMTLSLRKIIHKDK